MSESDDQLLRAFVQHGEEGAFGCLVERYQNVIHSAALRRSGSLQIAEEASQNVLMLLARKAVRLSRTPERLPAWLYRAATLEAGNLHRAEARHRRRIEALQASAVPMEGAGGDSAWEQALPHLRPALARLREADRKAVEMRYFQGRSFQEIGADLGKKPGAVQRQIHRSLERLAKALAARGVRFSVTTVAALLGGQSTKAVSPMDLLRVPNGVAKYATLSTPILTKTALLMTSKQKITIVALVILIPVALQYRRIRVLEERISLLEQRANRMEFVEAPSLPVHALDPVVPAVPPSRPEADEEMTRLRAELDAAQKAMSKINRSFADGVTSSTVKTELKKGETLVMGGFQEDGRYCFSFVKPLREMLPDGREAIKVETRMLSLTEDAIDAGGLDSLATNAANTIQHAEAWDQAAVDALLDKMNGQEGAVVVGMPSVYSLPSQDYEITSAIGGERGFTLNGKVGDAVGEADGFSMEVRLEFSEGENGVPSAE